MQDTLSADFKAMVYIEWKNNSHKLVIKQDLFTGGMASTFDLNLRAVTIFGKELTQAI
jgi:hypothetical protein